MSEKLFFQNLERKSHSKCQKLCSWSNVVKIILTNWIVHGISVLFRFDSVSFFNRRKFKRFFPKICNKISLFDILENFPVQIKSVTSEKELSQIDQARDLGCLVIFITITIFDENFHPTEIYVKTFHKNFLVRFRLV